MPTISSEGAAQEQRVLTDLNTTYSPRMAKRGFDPVRMKTYADLEKDMEAKRSGALGTDSDKRGLSGQEAALRQDLVAHLRPMQEAGKKAFPKGSPQLRELHVGDILSDSTPVVLAWAEDIATAALKYLTILAAKGVLQSDIDTINSLAEQLKSIDTRQQTAKTKARPEATAAFYASVKALTEFSDSIHTAAGLEFAKEPTVKAQFDAAKKLRFEVPPRKSNGDAPKQSGANPAGTTPPATK